MEAVTPRLFEWALASRTTPGHARSGDVHVVRTFAKGMLLGVIDGIGHGSEAAAVADAARQVLESFAEEPVEALVRRCHERLRGTRGVVMSLASVNAMSSLMAWVGVGNVQGVLLSRSPAETAEESLLLRSGVIGVRLPPIDAAVLPVLRGDTLVFATDGVKAAFDRTPAKRLSPQQAAPDILATYGAGGDDALVLVARYVGGR